MEESGFRFRTICLDLNIPLRKDSLVIDVDQIILDDTLEGILNEFLYGSFPDDFLCGDISVRMPLLELMLELMREPREKILKELARQLKNNGWLEEARRVYEAIGDKEGIMEIEKLMTWDERTK